ncbi:MAG: hypothetical protein KF824_02675 [Fimbriimonadaceae bacterium]|nr:MAG: hypothetical protein KF824_02675 [Fimbriimonadaceae bacterium]
MSEEPREEEVSEETSETEVEESFEPDPPEKVAEAEGLLRQANLAKVRKQGAVADRLLKEAAEIAPNSAAVLEAIGDDFQARNQYRRAKEMYGKAHKIDPTNPVIENKYAEMVLRVDLHVDPLTFEANSSSYASGKSAAILSFIVPGMGQIVLEKYVLGGTMFAMWIGGLIGFYLTPGGVAAVRNLFGTPAQGAASEGNPLGFAFLAVTVFAWLWSVSNINGSTKRMAPRKIDRPTPPPESLL